MSIIFPLEEKIVQKYNRNIVLIKAICDYCGKELYTFKSSLKNKTVFCNKICQSNFQTKNIEDFLKKCLEVHNKNAFDYSLVKYNGCFNKIKIKCNNCNHVFEQTPANHLQGRGCPNCAKKYIGELKKEKTILNFLEIAPKIHNNFYDYSLVNIDNFNTKTRKVKIICPFHGKFEQRIDAHLLGQRCKKCQVGKSKGENEIERILKENKVGYKIHHTFKDCKSSRNNYHLYFDFYIPNKKICIEFNGRQHYEPVNFDFKNINEKDNNTKFETQKFNDNFKKKYCLKNKIKLIIIPYWDLNNINEILKQEKII